MTAFYAIVGALVLIDLLILLPYALHRLVVHHGLRWAWIAWVPIIGTIFVPRLADASPFSWLLAFVPIVNLYVWWDWWSEIALDHHHPHPDRWAAGMLIPILGSFLLVRFTSGLPRTSRAPLSTSYG